jgi:protein-tyrosine kinase
METKAGPSTLADSDANSPSDRRRAIGAILVEQGILRPQDVDDIRLFAATNGLRFGDAAVELKRLTQYEIDTAVAHQFNYPVLACGGEDGVSPELVAAYEPQRETVEPLRILRSQLMLRWFNRADRKVLAITSSGRREGRSWLAANLATMFAQLGERTLLIDADLRRPTQHTLFNISNTIGLTSLLIGRAGREAVRRIDPQLRLFVLPAGNLPPNPQELLARPVFKVVLNLFAEQYDVILLDTPAAAESADAQILATQAGAAVMIVRLNHTRQPELLSVMQSFADIGVKVVGSIVNEHNR